MMKTSLFYGNPYEFRSYYSETGYFTDQYAIGVPDLSSEITDLTYAFGYGKLSAGMLDIAKGTKKFGVLGQHEEGAATGDD